MFGFILSAVVMAVFAALVYVYRDKIATMIPGWKHTVVGWLTALGSFILAIGQYLQTLDLSPFLHDPKNMLLVTGGLGLLVLVLSWVTPRASGQ